MRRATCFFTKISLIIPILDCFSCILVFWEEVAEQRHQNPKSDALSGVFDSPMEPQTEQRMFTRDELIALYRRRAKRYDLTANVTIEEYFLGFTYIASGVKVGEKDSFPHFSISQHGTDTGKELPVVR